MHKGNHSTRRIRLWIFLLLPLVLFVGCAVLTVDVDVYKGDLVNQKEVQVKQLAAMTMAAKPILEGLSNQLWIEIKQKNVDVEHLTNSSDINQWSLFKNVRELLSLYEDSSNVVQKMQPIRSAKIQSITTAYQNLTNSNTANFRGRMEMFSQTLTNAFPEFTPKAQSIITNLYKPSADLVEMARGLLDQASREGLTGGRADDGIETVITRYLNHSMNESDRDSEGQRYRKQLWIITVDFGEKVKFVADSQSPDILDTYSRYVMALEAIGNSILSLSDAISERFEFDKDERDIRSQWPTLSEAITNVANAARITNAVYLSNIPLRRLSATNTQTGSSNIEQSIPFLQQQDAVAQGLEDIQVAAMLSGQTNIANHAKAALDLVTAYRSDHIYILPTMTYLRNSYPATSLQKNDDGLWRNMLERESWRSLPWPFDEWAASGSASDRRNAKTQAEIDKQFWQNINQIRVAGSGITSYVITKDDIGNWYVKSYGSDPTPIIEGAKNLTLNTAIPAAVSPKLGQTVKTAAGTATNAVNPATLQPALLQTELNILQSNYNAATLDDSTNILLTTNLISDLSSQVGNIPAQSFTNILTNSFVLMFTNTNSVSISSNLVSSATFSHLLTNSTPGQSTNYVVTDIFSSSVTNLGFGAIWTNNFSGTSNYNVKSGTGSTVFTSSGTTNSSVPPENVVLHATNAVVLLTNSGTFQVVFKAADAPMPNAFATNVVVQFTNLYATSFTNTNVAPIVLADIAASTNTIGSSNLVTATFYDTVTNIPTVISIVTNSVIQTITYACQISYSTNGTYTNVFNWSIINTNTVVAPPDGTNLVLTALAGNFSNNISTGLTSLNLDFLRTGYNQQVSPALSGLVSTLTNSSPANISSNITTIAASEQKVLQQWNQVIVKASLSGISNQNQIVLKYVAPQIRSLANQRVANLKTYEDGLNLLSQSQAQ